MAKTLLELLAGEDMEGGENFCDDVYNFLKNQGKDINLLTNSGFGVWSQSDAAKGLALLPYTAGSDLGGGDVPDVGDAALGATSGATGKIISYTITGGAFDTDDAIGVLTLGAVTGTFQTGETINFTDGETALVGADADIGVKNDPCNNDSTGIWTRDAGLNLAFGAALYTVDTNAVDLRAWITAGATLVAGKIYKIELDIEDGVVNTRDIQGYFDDGVAQYGRIETTGGAFVSVSWVFECATSTPAGKVGFRIVENLGGAGQNIHIRRFSCYEITPCCTNNADNNAFDGWTKDSTLDIYRQHDDGGTLTKDGSFYSLKLVNSAIADYVSFEAIHYYPFVGRTVTLGMWMKTSTASHARIRILDSIGSDFSGFHTGGGDWEWLEVTRTVDANTTNFFIYIYAEITPAVNGDTIIYLSQPMLVFGSSLGEGMYQPRLQEWIRLEIRTSSNELDALIGSGDVAGEDINLEADTDGVLPKGATAVRVHARIRDSGSATWACYLTCSPDNGGYWYFTCDCGGLTDDQEVRKAGEIGMNPSGDYQYAIEASAGATLDVETFQYMAVQVN